MITIKPYIFPIVPWVAGPSPAKEEKVLEGSQKFLNRTAAG